MTLSMPFLQASFDLYVSDVAMILSLIHIYAAFCAGDVTTDFIETQMGDVL